VGRLQARSLPSGTIYNIIYGRNHGVEQEDIRHPWHCQCWRSRCVRRINGEWKLKKFNSDCSAYWRDNAHYETKEPYTYHHEDYEDSLYYRKYIWHRQKCDRFVVYDSTDDAVAIARSGLAAPLLILGGGSNLLLTHDFHGTVVTPARRFEAEVLPHNEGSDAVLLRCWAGTTFDEVVDYAVDHDWHGLENLSLIPGQCGASAVQNIGAYGAEIKDVLVDIEAVELAGQGGDDCRRRLRLPLSHSRFKAEWKDATHYLCHLQTVGHLRPRLDYGNIRQVLAEVTSPKRAHGAQLRDAVIDIRRASCRSCRDGQCGQFLYEPCGRQGHL
jgi:UDP-N-acetylmuramate dehydrogenase